MLTDDLYASILTHAVKYVARCGSICGQVWYYKIISIDLLKDVISGLMQSLVMVLTPLFSTYFYAP